MYKYSQLYKAHNAIARSSIPISLKDCKNCLYYVKETIEEESLCMKFGKKTNDIDANPNVPKFETAKTCRSDTDKCGESGLYYLSNLLH